MRAAPLLLLACGLPVVFVGAARPPEQRPCHLQPWQLRPGNEDCHWHDAGAEEGITSWEFQLRVDKVLNRTRPRGEWEAFVERSFAAVERRVAGLRFDRSTRRAMVWHEAERALSTDDGQPLDPKAARAGTQYPFRQIGVLRLRQCLAVHAAAPGEERHLLRPGESDLTLKLKDVDPARPPTWHKACKPAVHGAALAVKLENDVHCGWQRRSYSAVYRRAPGLAPHVLHTLERVHDYFPALPKQLRLDKRCKLPLHLNHYQSKTYWDLTLDGVPGTVQLYANSPDRHSALAGSAAYPFELSMRITRKDAGEQLQHALALLAEAATVLGQNGWDAAPATSAPRDLA